MFSIRGHLDALWLFANLQRFGYRPGSDVDNADLRLVFVGNVELLPIRANVEIFRIRTARDDAQHLALRYLEDTDAIGALVGRWQGALIHIRSGDGRATERNIDCLVIGTRVDATRTLTQRNSREHVVVAGIDDAEIA